MDKILIEQRKLLVASCHKREKYGDAREGNCPYGFVTLNPTCRNCVWFTTKKLTDGINPFTYSMKINLKDIEALELEYSKKMESNEFEITEREN